MSDHVVGLRLYLSVFFALMVLTAVTVGIAYVDLGPANDVVAMGIATTKALLVVLFFMHLRSSTRLSKLAIASSVAFFVLLVVVVFADVLTRDWLDVPGRDLNWP